MTKRKQSAFAALFTGLVLSTILVLFRADTLSIHNALLAAAIMLVGIIPGVIYLCKPRNDRSPFPLMPLTGIFYAFFFGFPAFLAYYLIDGSDTRFDIKAGDTRIEFYSDRFLDSISTEAQILVLIGVSVMFFTWAVAGKYLFNSMPVFAVSKPPGNRSLILIAWGLVAANIAYLNVPEIRSLPSIGQFLQPAGFLGFAIFYLLKNAGELSRPNIVIYFFGALPAWGGSLIASGSLTPVLMIIVLWLALRIATTKKFPWGGFIALPIFLFVAYPHLDEFRERFWANGEDATSITKVLEFSKMIVSGALNENEGAHVKSHSLLGVVRRVSLILPMSAVVEQTPQKVPYWNGKTYNTLFTGWIPRFIWPSKPKELWGNAFGHRYDIFRIKTEKWSMNLPWITEMYANFGRLGVLLGMALVGLFLGFLDRLLNSANRNSIELAVGATILLPLFYQESNFTLMTGSLLPLTLGFWLMFAVGLRLPFPWRTHIK